MYYPPILRAMLLLRINEKRTKIKHWLRYVTFPPRRSQSRQKSPGGGNRVNVRGRRTVHVTVWHVHIRYISECLRMGPEQVHGASLISLDDQRGRKIYTLRTLYIFNSLALMSLALVAPKTARFTCRVRIFDLNFSEILWPIRSRFFGINRDGDEFRAFVLPYNSDLKNNAGILWVIFRLTIFGGAFLSYILFHRWSPELSQGKFAGRDR